MYTNSNAGGTCMQMITAYWTVVHCMRSTTGQYVVHCMRWVTGQTCMYAIYYRTVVHIYEQLPDCRVCIRSITGLSCMYTINYRTVVHAYDQLQDSRAWRWLRITGQSCMYQLRDRRVCEGLLAGQSRGQVCPKIKASLFATSYTGCVSIIYYQLLYTSTIIHIPTICFRKTKQCCFQNDWSIHVVPGFKLTTCNVWDSIGGGTRGTVYGSFDLVNNWRRLETTANIVCWISRTIFNVVRNSFNKHRQIQEFIRVYKGWRLEVVGILC